MAQKYNRDFKKMICELIVLQKHSTMKTADEFCVPLKTVENWITAYNKDRRDGCELEYTQLRYRNCRAGKLFKGGAEALCCTAVFKPKHKGS